MTLTFEFHLDGVQKQHTKYPAQRSFSSNVIVRT